MKGQLLFVNNQLKPLEASSIAGLTKGVILRNVLIIVNAGHSGQKGACGDRAAIGVSVSSP
ncbi:hypothetical protein [Laceyella sacchari]|uniref:Uncharacterized protein n=1 Tax=Laceyella sacchari TaxID=37482 RepID=A0ABY5U329_LACSH|nr:hypothetical protein [Laceyella sacchari]UWE04029.1 hypothetical protein NYR52_02360 [Laceyella sacchari]